MTKVTYERGKTMTYPTMYPRLLVTPIFAHEDDFMWIEKIVCKYDAEIDVDEPEFSFRRDTVHIERNDALKAENAKLRELIKLADKLMQGVLEHSKDTVVVSDLPCCDTLYDRLAEYRQAERELGIEVEQRDWGRD